MQQRRRARDLFLRLRVARYRKVHRAQPGDAVIVLLLRDRESGKQQQEANSSRSQMSHLAASRSILFLIVPVRQAIQQFRAVQLSPPVVHAATRAFVLASNLIEWLSNPPIRRKCSVPAVITPKVSTAKPDSALVWRWSAIL